ncbi:unnamed protein product, partial [Closterium sp. NIES-54]
MSEPRECAERIANNILEAMRNVPPVARGRPKAPKDNAPLRQGGIYSSKDKALKAVQAHTLHHCFGFVTVEVADAHVIFQCKTAMYRQKPICPWECSYSRIVHGGFWMVTSLSPLESHVCKKYKQEQGAKAIANSVKVMKRLWGNLVRGASFISAKMLQQILTSHSKISYKHARRLREAIQKEMYGDWQESFRLLPALADRFREIELDGNFLIQTVDGCFNRMYIQPSASRGSSSLPPRPLGLSVPAATTAATATFATAAPTCSTAMASLRVLAFDHEGRLVLLVALRARPSLRGAPPPPLPPPTPLLLLLQMSQLLRTSGLLLLVRSASVGRARVARVVDVEAGVVVGAAVEVVAAAGLVEGVGALVAAVEAAVGVAAVAAVGLVAVGRVLGVLVLQVASVSSSSVGARPSRPNSFVSGFCVRRLGVVAHIAEGDCYRCVPPDPGIAAAALGASESGTLPGTAPAKPLHNFTLDSGASRCFFCDSTTLTPLPTPVPIRLADPSGGPVVARSSTVLPYVAVPSGSLLGLHLPSFSTNLVAASCSCRLLSHQTLLWHHHLGHPSLPCLRGMHSRLLVSRLPRSLPPLLPSPTPPCLPCFEGRQRAAPHSSSFPPTTAPLQTLHIDVWGPARVSGQSRERYFLLVVDDYTRPARVNGQLHERFGQDLPVLRLHSDRGGEFSSNLLRKFSHGEGILQSFTLPGSPRKNGIAERRIGLVMEVARTSMIHAAAPHFMWPFAVDPLPDTAPVEVAVGSGAARGAASGGAACGGEKPGGARSEGAGSGGAEPGGEEPGGLDPEGVEPGGAESEGAEFGGAEPRGVASSGSPAGGSPGAPGAGGAGDTGAGGAGVLAGARGTGGTAAAGRGGARTRGAGAAGIGGVGGARAGDPTEPGAAGTRGAGAGGARFGGTGAGGAGPASPLPAPSFYTEKSGGLTECRQPASRPTSFVCTARRVPHSRPPPVPSTHAMALRPSSIPLRVPLPAPPESSLPEVPDLESDRAPAASPTVSRLLATAVTDPSLNYATALVAESGYASPSSIRDEVPPPGANIVDGMWIFRLKRPPGSPPAFKARYVARGFSQRQGVDYFQTFFPIPKMTTLWVLLHVAAQRDYELHPLCFSTAFLQGSLHEEIWLRRPPSFTESFRA